MAPIRKEPTALRAMDFDNAEMVGLLDAGADPNESSTPGYNALHPRFTQRWHRVALVVGLVRTLRSTYGA